MFWDKSIRSGWQLKQIAAFGAFEVRAFGILRVGLGCIGGQRLTRGGAAFGIDLGWYALVGTHGMATQLSSLRQISCTVQLYMVALYNSKFSPSTAGFFVARQTALGRTATPSKSDAAQRAQQDLPFTTVDLVIFTVLDDELQVLLVQRPQTLEEPYPSWWALPGGYVDVTRDADLLSCAQRKLKDKTGVSTPYLEQLGSWGSKSRDPRAWSATHVYFALIPSASVVLVKGANSADVKWFKVDTVSLQPKLAFDHAGILVAAVERLRGKVEYTSLPAFLLPEPFTLPQLQRMYELVLGRVVDKSGFRTRTLAANFLVEVGVVAGTSKRPAMGYRLSDRRRVEVFPRTFSPRATD